MGSWVPGTQFAETFSYFAETFGFRFSPGYKIFSSY